MKNLLLILLSIAIFTCKNNEPAPGKIKLKYGYYSGTFQYDSINVWESILFKKDSFFELASGGIMNQKFRDVCLTMGMYKIEEDTITFDNVQITVPPMWDRCKEECLLKGKYFIAALTDSTIIFLKDAVKGKQYYTQKLYYEEK